MCQRELVHHFRFGLFVQLGFIFLVALFVRLGLFIRLGMFVHLWSIFSVGISRLLNSWTACLEDQMRLSHIFICNFVLTVNK